jgi:hypothetical protein
MNATRIGRQSREVNDMLLSLKGLILVRALLEDRGASAREIREHGDEIERLRGRLAELVREGGGAYSAAA